MRLWHGIKKDLAETHKHSSIKLTNERSKIPSESKIRSLFTSFKKEGFGDINTNSDLEAWAGGNTAEKVIIGSKKRGESSSTSSDT